jgi:geranylgeranyl diphosphate synthase type I
LIDPIAKYAETIWKETGLSQEFSGSLKQTLFFISSNNDPRKTRVRQLPEICCQAAGGDPALAGPVSAAWLIFNRAAHIMDSVQDGDVPEPWWEKQGSGFALNVASAFYFTATKILDGLEGYGIASRSAAAIRNTFSRLLLQMCEGQHLDLTATKATLDDYWRIVNFKSGLFFAIGCRSGAELVLDDTKRLGGFEAYGKGVGVIIQLSWELTDKNLSMPLSYAYTMLPEDQQILLSENIARAKFDSNAVQSVLTMLDHIGVAPYMKLEIARHARFALDGLEQAKPIETARGILEDLVNTLIN